MYYRDFLQEVEKQVHAGLREGDKVRIKRVRKNNGVFLDCMVVQITNSVLSPSFHMDECFKNYLQGMKVEEIVSNILSICEDSRAVKDSTFDFLENFNNIRDRLVGHLVNREKNKDILEDVPHRDFLNLTIVYYCILDDQENSAGGFMVRNHMMQEWGVTEERVHQEAVMNMKLRYPVQFMSISELMKNYLGQKDWKEENADTKLYVLSNVRRMYGAYWITEKEIQEKIADFFASDYYVLPSSVHECLLLPAQEGMDEKQLLSMVTDINRTQVADQEFLADAVYRYNRAGHCMTLAAG